MDILYRCKEKKRTFQQPYISLNFVICQEDVFEDTLLKLCSN
jgi:hypothetical protein